jgi:hypothetical protein
MIKEHRAGVHECCLVIHHLKLENLDHDKAEAIGQEIDTLIGVDMVSLNDETSVLNVAYDAGKLNVDDIEAIVRKHGADISHRWWTQFKEGWYRFTDQNVRDNMQHEPLSCHQTPPGKR